MSDDILGNFPRFDLPGKTCTARTASGRERGENADLYTTVVRPYYKLNITVFIQFGTITTTTTTTKQPLLLRRPPSC